MISHYNLILNVFEGLNMKQVIDLMGNLVSFEIQNNEELHSILGETTTIKGLVTGVALHLNGNHEILVKDFDNGENYYDFSKIDTFKVAQLDPELLFENIRSGAFEIEL
jgi:hypothetical protein